MAENYYVDEANNAQLEFNLVDETGGTISLAAIGTFHLTFYNKCDESSQYYLATINARATQDILNANNVVVSASGTVTWSIQYADNPIFDDTEKEEQHVALFEFYYGGNKGSIEFNFFVRNVHYVS